MADSTVIDAISRRVGNTLSWLFLISVVISCYEVLMSSAFQSPTIWVHDSATMLGAICFLFGGAYALQRGDHIRITFVYDMLPRRGQQLCDLIGLILALLYLVGLGWFAGSQALNSIRIVEMSGRAWNFPMPMVIRTAFFLGVALLALQAAAELWKLIRAFRGARR
ncbi:MAG TPA: TRAP transporter small permease subunit [Microvirga sp.]|nr:TRAP transporter small permease subunit [Microvirga sp.]